MKKISKKPKKTQKKSQPKQSYWQGFLKDFTTSAKLWLEGFEVSHALDKNQKNYHKATITLHKNLINEIKKKYHHGNKQSLMALLNAAFAILQHRYSGADDIMYGTAPFATSKRTEDVLLSDIILPMRSFISEQKSIKSYIDDIHQTLKNNYKHLGEFKKNNWATQYKDLYRYLIVHHDKINKKNNRTTIDLHEYPLVLMLKKERPLTLEMLFNPNKFSVHSIKNLIQHFVIILEKIITDPEAELAHFSILTATEKRNILNKWSKPFYPAMPRLDPAITVHTLFSQKAQGKPDNLAIAYNQTQLSYQALDQVSNQIAHFLLEKNISGEHIAVLMERTPALLAVMLGIFKAGLVYVPINPKYPDDRIEFVLNDCGANTIFVNSLERIPAGLSEKTVIMDDRYEVCQSFPKEPVRTVVTADQTAYIIYTSGTTGQPKGVMIKHMSLVNLTYWYQTLFSLTESDRASQFASQGFDSFFCETVPFLCTGASIHIIDDHTKLVPQLMIDWIEKQKITVLDMTTAYAQVLFNLPWPAQSDLRLAKIGGESLARYPTQLFTFDIWNCYGPTEATVEATFIKIYEKNTPPHHNQSQHVPPPIGKPIANAEVYVVDTHFEPVPIGDVGELLIGGIIIASGYLHRKQLTREKFIRNLFSQDPNAKLYRTGDLVRWLEDGNLEFVGRVDHQIKVRGYRIELSEVETTIRQYPDVGEVVVIAKDAGLGQKTLVAYLVPKLDKIRIPYQERCLLAFDDTHYIEASSEDLSKEGIAVNSLSEKIKIDQKIRINIKLPGANEPRWLEGRVAWSIDQHAGIEFDKTPVQSKLLQQSIEYYLATHNLMETLRNVATKRSVRKALKRKLPDYMIPGIFSVLPQMPLTFNGKIDWKALPAPHDFERLLERQHVGPRTETEKEVAAIWKKVLNVDKVSITDNFFDIGGNSLLVSQLSVELLHKFNLTVPIKVFFDLPFIPILAEYIETKGERYSFKSTIQDEINHDSILNDNIMPKKKWGGDIKKPRGILLTGAGGFLGIYLLRELLRQTDAKIYCLVRKGEFESSAKRLIATINQFELSEEISLANRRIIIISGDIALDQFGLPAEQYQNLAEKVDVIFHCGAQVNTMMSYTTLRGSNVLGTIEVIKFATQGTDKALHYVSTLSAAYKTDDHGNFTEEFPDSSSGNLVGGYAISKWVSERLITQIKNRGLPVSIFRSGYILGQSDTGISNLNDSLLLLIKGCIQLGFAPQWKEKIAILPVDFVSKAMVAIALNHPEVSDVYHLDHPHGIMWTDLVAWLHNYGFDIKLCTHAEWRHHLTTIDTSNALYPFLPYYLSLLKEPQTPGTNMGNSKKAFKEINIHYPEISDHLLQLYFNYLCRVGFIPSPSKSIAIGH